MKIFIKKLKRQVNKVCSYGYLCYNWVVVVKTDKHLNYTGFIDYKTAKQTYKEWVKSINNLRWIENVNKDLTIFNQNKENQALQKIFHENVH